MTTRDIPDANPEVPAGMSERDVVKATNPDPDDAASWCDDCGAAPGEPCELNCPWRGTRIGQDVHAEWAGEVTR